ncbi:uncharacterized protein LDX57_012195 [Aspergillus melleus]|uniref:uncharacterized protein n=1 Tax=Aspergillus melleus TaxID=138277 RepID=UPI001E8DDE5A|nr:uncharacterized protein LDX57_012195 [Aspergillus melleus]KAH8434552.1 hypothetical protein LDX57_012195 [Aspergillus melleus]
MERDAIKKWIEGVAADNQTSQPTRDSHARDAHGVQESLLTPPGTSLRQEDRAKRRHTGMDAPSDMSRSDPQKRLRQTLTTGAEAASLSDPLCEDITLSPSITTRSDLTPSDRPRQRSSSPNRIKSNLASGTPKIKYLHESADPGSDSASQLLEFLTADNNDRWEPEAHEIDKISTASCKCATQLRSEGSWIIEVVRPLLQCVIETLPLECWSV